jgi:hypothetical protein
LTVAFCGTILFLITFEHITKLIEKMVGGSPTYNKMLQRLYKELMSNGNILYIQFTKQLIVMQDLLVLHWPCI